MLHYNAIINIPNRLIQFFPMDHPRVTATAPIIFSDTDFHPESSNEAVTIDQDIEHQPPTLISAIDFTNIESNVE